MAWWIDNFFMKVLVGVAVIFTSKVLRSIFAGIYRQVLIAMGVATLKIAEGRLRQAESDYKAVVELRGDSTKMARHIMGSLMPMFLCTLIIVSTMFYCFTLKAELPQGLSYALIGIASVNLRWFFEAVSAYGLVIKAADFAAYEARFFDQQKELKSLCKKLGSGAK